MQKHILPTKDVEFGQPQESILLVTKNPYMWIEGFIYTNEIETMGNPADDPKREMWNEDILKEFNILDEEMDTFKLEPLAKMYKVFNKTWMFSKFVKEPVFHVKYEDFLFLEKAEKVIGNLSYTLKSNLKLPNKPVRWSPNFTEDDFNYYKNEIPTHLSSEDIAKINNIIGKDFIESLGYKVR